MNKEFALKVLQRLISENKFVIVHRRAKHAKAVSNEAVKIIVAQLTIDDFVKVSEDRAFPGEYLWIYETEMGVTYYIKCKFSSDLNLVKFISFHQALY